MTLTAEAEYVYIQNLTVVSRGSIVSFPLCAEREFKLREWVASYASRISTLQIIVLSNAITNLKSYSYVKKKLI